MGAGAPLSIDTTTMQTMNHESKTASVAAVQAKPLGRMALLALVATLAACGGDAGGDTSAPTADRAAVADKPAEADVAPAPIAVAPVPAPAPRPAPVGTLPSRPPVIVPLPTVPLEATVDRRALLGLLASMPEGSWRMMASNQFRDAWAPVSHQPLNQGNHGLDRSAVIGAWGGFAWDSKRSELLLLGGGHAAYAGNELYRWRGSTLAWERASLPSQVVKRVFHGQDIWVPVDGAQNAPQSPHAYDLSDYLPGVDRFVNFPAAIFNSYFGAIDVRADGSARLAGPYLFDLRRSHPDMVAGTPGSGVVPSSPGTQAWSERNQVQQYSARKFGVTDGTSAVVTEAGKDVMYMTASLDGQTLQHLFRYAPGDMADATTDRLTRVGSGVNCCDGRGSGAIDPYQRVYLRTGQGSTPFIYWSLGGTLNAQNNAVTVRPTDTTGGAAPVVWSSHGVDFDRQRRVYMMWGGGADVWVLTPPAGDRPSATGWTLSRAPVVGAPVPGPSEGAGGVLGKWKYAPELGVFVALRGVSTGEVWMYKPLGWRPPA